MDIIFGYLAGLLTLINPCVLPVLPIALASAFSANKYGPLALAAGLTVTFTTLGLLVASIGPLIGLTEEHISQGGALLMLAFGIVLLVPKLNERFATATSGFASQADTQIYEIDQSGLRGQFLAGVLLGAVWSPCIGPTLGGAISLASQGGSLIFAGAIMLSFSLGISTVVLALAYGTREAIRTRQDALRSLAEKSKPIMGVIFILVGLAILFKINHYIDAALLDIMPEWLLNLSVSL